MTKRRYKSGVGREQFSLLPPSIEDYVDEDNPVQAIEDFVESLDLAGLGFAHCEADNIAGQPPYDPACLLKLYLYGYLNSVRSSRRLEREAARNLEVIWLMGGLKPSSKPVQTNETTSHLPAFEAVYFNLVSLIGDLEKDMQDHDRHLRQIFGKVGDSIDYMSKSDHNNSRAIGN